MSSPFTFSSHLAGQPTCSPFPTGAFPYPSPNIAPSPLAGLLAQAGSPAVGFGFPGTPQTFLSVPPAAAQTSTSRGTGTGTGTGTGSEISIDVVLRGIDEVLGVLTRLEQAIQGMMLEQQAVFGSGGPDDSVERGSPGRIIALQQEYAQTLISLQPLLTSSLLGALPVPLSAASSKPQPLDTTSAPPADLGLPSIPELTAWAERRAELEFSRREGVRAGAKAVLDVFKR